MFAWLPRVCVFSFLSPGGVFALRRGGQMSAMSNRTVLVDNNTWNNTHIATVGRALASSEEKAYPIMEVRVYLCLSLRCGGTVLRACLMTRGRSVH